MNELKNEKEKNDRFFLVQDGYILLKKLLSVII